MKAGNTKRELVDYLLGVMHQLEREEGKRITYTDFAKMVDLPIKTVTSMFDPDDTRLPNRSNAEKVAIAIGSDEITKILGYPAVDPLVIETQKVYRTLTRDQKMEVLEYMRSMDKEK